ncbi:PIG-L family deacetylase [Pseudarthrobacter sp. P1]|uniref:PIG-L family deacetylase n=1 Tax=Pseudarthrobacter sp. P1 TaxID=3418418 RepID=UPI003CF8D499
MTHPQPAPGNPWGGLLPLTRPPAHVPDSQTPRLLFIHAHPDDETLVTGATMARYVQLGARVALLTCTRGELGEVIGPELAHLEVGQGATDGGAGLAAEREHELAGALAALGVHEHHWLGAGAAGDGTDTLYRDSGMQWGPDGRAMPADTVLAGSLSRAPLDEVAAHAARLIRALRPHAVVTYAADGGYGHPDHIRTHELAIRALELAAEGPDGLLAPWQVSSVFTIVSDRPERPLDPDAARIAVHGDKAAKAAKAAAMLSHRTQVTVAGDRYALSDDVWKDISGTEEFQKLAVPAAHADTAPAHRPAAAHRSAAVRPSAAGAAAAAVGAGLGAGLLGTALHGQALYTSGGVLPLGAAAALLLLLSLALVAGLWGRRIWVSLAVGAVAYAVAGILSIPRGGLGLIVANLQGNVWLYGIAVATPIAALICRSVLRRDAARF